MAISLNTFIENSIGKKLSNPNGSYPGQCVSLVQQYLYQCLDIPFQARGNAKDWVNLPSDIAVSATGTPKAGDIVVFPTRGVVDGVTYGHIGVAVSSTEIFEQNVHPNYVAEKRLFSNISGDRVLMRPVKALVGDTPPTPGWNNPAPIYLNATKQQFRVRASVVSGAQKAIVPVGGRAEITGFLGIQSDNYQWVSVDYNGVTGFSQVDTKNCYTVTTANSTGRYLNATRQAFRVRASVVNGTQKAMVPVGGRAEITGFLGIQSDGYQWVSVSYNGVTGYSQADTYNCYTFS
jgi:CHAP domain.